MMIVQKVEFSGNKSYVQILYFQSSVSLLSCIISVLQRFYVVVIYINHFKSLLFAWDTIPLWLLTTIGNMTNLETNDIRNLSPYPL